MANNRRHHISAASRRKARQYNIGLALIVVSALGFAALIAAAYLLDKAQGVTLMQSLGAWGVA